MMMLFPKNLEADAHWDMTKIFDYLSSVSLPPFIEDVLKPFDEEKTKATQEHKKGSILNPSSEEEI